MGFVMLISGVVPLALLAAIALPRAPTVPEFLLGAGAMTAGLLFAWAVFPWDVTSHYLRQVLPWATLVAGVIGYRRIGTAKDGPPPNWQRGLGAGISAVVLVLFAGLCWRVFLGYPAPEGAIRLAAPLQDGRFVVGQGGASPFINGHFRVDPQNHALDVLELNGAGRRSTWGASSDDLEAWTIFGQPVLAPCEGRVLVTVDGLPDLPVGERDRRNLAGNHVVVECGDVEVVLAHLRQGSVTVATGDTVAVGDRLGEVGNSGNTSEPHLHLHAERGGPRGVILEGEAVPMLIDGRYLVRGDVF